MAMRLLPKSEVLQAKASQRRQDIDAGMKLAKRVDATRESLATEERKLEKFRVESVKAIQSELAPLTKQRDDLKEEVKDLKDERRQLQKPLDKEWAEVRTAKKDAELIVSKAHALMAAAQEADQQARKAIRLASDALGRALTKEERTKDTLSLASEREKAATETLLHAQEVETKVVELAEAAEAEFASRDNSYALKENGLILREANLTDGEADLAKGWKLLKDRQRTLERNINRAKK